MNRQIFFLMLVFAPAIASAQVKTIRVVDKQIGSPLIAYYQERDNSYSIRTNNSGRFEIPNFITGMIEVSAPGYETRELELTDTLTMISLERAPILLTNQITITAKRIAEQENQVTEAVTIIQQQEIETLSPRSTPELLMASPGIWVQKTNHGGGSPIIRGLVGNQILLMVDGIRMNNATYRYGPNQYLATIDPGMINRLEVVRGGGSVLYGSDALGGVLQIFSRQPSFNSNGQSLNGSLMSSWMSAGMEKSIRGEVELSGEKVAVHSALSIRDFGDLVAGGSLGTLAPTAYNEYSTDTKILVRTDATSVLTGAFQHHQQNNVPRYDQVQFGGFSTFKFDPQIRQLGYLRWKKTTARKLINSFQSTVALSRSFETTISQRSNSSDVRKLHDDTYSYSASLEVNSLPADFWNAMTGVELYSDKVSSTGEVLNTQTQESTAVRGNYADGASSQNIAIFSSHTFDLNRFTFAAGGRFNAVTLAVDDATFGNVKIRPSALVWNSGISYSISGDVRLHASANTAFRAPNVDDVSRFGPVESTVFEIPSTALNPERSMTFEVGAKGTFNHVNWNIAAYKTQLTDLIDRVSALFMGSDSAENRKVFRKDNINEAQITGIEGDMEWQLNNHFSVDANFTYTRGENISRNEPIRRIPPLFGKAGIVYHYGNGLSFRADFLAASRQTRLAVGDKSDVRISSRLVNGEMPAWSVVNVYSSYEFKNVSLLVSALNLFDKNYRVYASGVDGIGRAIKFTVAIKL